MKLRFSQSLVGDVLDNFNMYNNDEQVKKIVLTKEVVAGTGAEEEAGALVEDSEL